jgi:hypothetical protein
MIGRIPRSLPASCRRPTASPRPGPPQAPATAMSVKKRSRCRRTEPFDCSSLLAGDLASAPPSTLPRSRFQVAGGVGFERTRFQCGGTVVVPGMSGAKRRTPPTATCRGLCGCRKKIGGRAAASSRRMINRWPAGEVTAPVRTTDRTAWRRYDENPLWTNWSGCALWTVESVTMTSEMLNHRLRPYGNKHRTDYQCYGKDAGCPTRFLSPC